MYMYNTLGYILQVLPKRFRTRARPQVVDAAAVLLERNGSNNSNNNNSNTNSNNSNNSNNKIREWGGDPRNPAPRSHFLVWIVKPSGCHCTDALH